MSLFTIIVIEYLIFGFATIPLEWDNIDEMVGTPYSTMETIIFTVLACLFIAVLWPVHGIEHELMQQEVAEGEVKCWYEFFWEVPFYKYYGILFLICTAIISFVI